MSRLGSFTQTNRIVPQVKFREIASGIYNNVSIYLKKCVSLCIMTMNPNPLLATVFQEMKAKVCRYLHNLFITKYMSTNCINTTVSYSLRLWYDECRFGLRQLLRCRCRLRHIQICIHLKWLGTSNHYTSRNEARLGQSSVLFVKTILSCLTQPWYEYVTNQLSASYFRMG